MHGGQTSIGRLDLTRGEHQALGGGTCRETTTGGSTVRNGDVGWGELIRGENLGGKKKFSFSST